MTPAQFLSALSTNFALTISNYTAVTNLSTPDLQTLLNANFSKSDTYLGIRGSLFAGIINNNFKEHDISISKSTSFNVIWVDDFAQITFTDNSGGLAQHEIWESKNGGSYVLAYTLSAGITTYDYYTQQNTDLNYKIRSKNGSLYSEFTSVVNIITPLVLRCNQSVLTQLLIKTLNISSGVVNINWDDGNNNNYNGNNTNITKNYLTIENPYFIKISGDVNNITTLELYEQVAVLAGTDITKWNLPNVAFFCHLWSNGFIGDLIDWDINGNLPSTIYGIYLADNELIGDLSGWHLENKANWWDIHLNSNNFTGNLSNWEFGAEIAHLTLGDNNFTGNLSNWELPQSFSYSSSLYDLTNDGFSGDLSNWVLPIKTAHIESNYTPFTRLPRGNFANMQVYKFYANNCNSAEIDSILAYIDAYFTGGVVPLANCVYTLNGTGMGIPSAAGLISRTSIIAKYTSAGKTCSILVNS